MEQLKKEKYVNKSEIRQKKNVDWIDKAMGALTHPLTAFGYAARNEELPDNFQKAENTNPLDDVIGMVNPARRFMSGVDAMESVGNGDFQKAGVDMFGVVNPWTKATKVISGTGRLARNRRVAQAAGDLQVRFLWQILSLKEFQEWILRLFYRQTEITKKIKN
jgi:hypothetical protein